MEGLAGIPIFQKLNPVELGKLSSVTERRKYGTDTVVFFEGDPSDALYLIVSGSVKVHQTTKDGDERILKILNKGAMFGELAMLDGHPRSATVTTLAPTEMLVLSHKGFRNFASERPEVLWRVLEALCERIRSTSASMLDLTFKDPPYRLLSALVQLINTHGEAKPDGTWINLKLTARDLASMIGTNKETVQRLIHEFHDDGLIRLEGKHTLVIPDVHRLSRALEYASDWS